MNLYFIANANLVHAWNWLRPIIGHGHVIRILSYAPVQRQFDGFDEVETIDLCQINNTPRLRFLYWARWLKNYLTNEKVDILHAHQVQAAGWLGWLSGFHPLVVSAWGSDLLIEPHKNRVRRWLVQRVLSACDRLVTPSPELSKAAIALGFPEKQIDLIPWAVDTQVFSPYPQDRKKTLEKLGLPPDSQIILSPRSPTPRYNIKEIILAFGQIAANREGIYLILLEFNPDPEYVFELRSIVTELNLTESVRWLPAITNRFEMAELYRAAHVMVSIPSSEGYGLSVYEAMACGCACVITDLPVFEQRVIQEKHALKIIPGDVGGLVEALVFMLDHPTSRKAFATEGIELAGSMSEDSLGLKIEELYSKVLSAHN